jgi:putative hemolysin
MDTVRLWIFGFAAATVLLFLLHIWLASGIAALQEIRPKWKTTESKTTIPLRPTLSNLLQKPKQLERMAATAQILFHALFPPLFSGAVSPWIAYDLLPKSVSASLSTWQFAAIFLTVAAIGCLLVFLIGAALPLQACKEPEKRLEQHQKLFSFCLCCLQPLQAIVAALIRLFCGREAVSETVTEEEILSIVDAGTENGLIATQQKEMIDNILEFDDIDISDVMTHRRNIVGVAIDAKIMDVVYLAVNESYSRMPVYRENIDNIVGVLIVKDLLALIGAENVENFTIEHFMREVLFLPETAKCKNVLTEMTRHNAQMAVAVDEYGGTAGIVTVEDILEEIVGSIRDEYDEEEAEQELRMVSDNVYIIKGAADPEEVLPKLGVSLPEGKSFDTMSGFLVEQLGRIPDAEESPVIQYEHIRFTVLLVEENWIAKIKAEIQKNDEEEKPDEAV